MAWRNQLQFGDTLWICSSFSLVHFLAYQRCDLFKAGFPNLTELKTNCKRQDTEWEESNIKHAESKLSCMETTLVWRPSLTQTNMLKHSISSLWKVSGNLDVDWLQETGDMNIDIN